jgi:heme-degrading monooxygenase HmoA
MFIIIWEFIVAESREAEFEKIYGSQGEWAQLFKQGKGYLGTELLCDMDNPRYYITIDRWISSSAFDSFQEKFRLEYETMDARCESLTERGTRIGMGDLPLGSLRT